ELICVDTKGKEKWRKNLPKDLGGQVNPVGGGAENPDMGWGYACSPLVDGDQLIITPGGPKGMVAALDKKTGNGLWQSKDVKHHSTYSSPVLATIAGEKQVVAMTQEGAVAVSAKNGALLWEFKRKAGEYGDIVAPTPIVVGDEVYITAAKGGGSTLLKIENKDGKFSATPVYTKGTLSNMTGGVVKVGDHLYGSHETVGWRCIEFKTGNSAWQVGDQGACSVIAVGNQLICTDSDKDEVMLVAADPKAYTEVSRFTLPETSKLRKTSTKFWTYPVVANGFLYLRDQELLFCYQVK